MEERVALLALSRIEGVTCRDKRRTLDAQGSAASLFERKGRCADPLLASKIEAFDGFDLLDRELKRLTEMGVAVVSLKDDGYPPLLRNIPDAPLVLYKRGPLQLTEETIAIVGSRKATFEGTNIAEKIGETLSSLGVTVVSGFARGIDSAAHRGALREKGKTVAVLGCGMDICYPAENLSLFEEIGQEGMILSEYPLGERPFPKHFPERNRIIAGLSKGVLVIEASSRSGSLITARLGLEYGRDVMAVPGRVFDEEYKGANSLIKQGARLIESVDDVLTTCFPHLRPPIEEPVDLDKDEQYICDMLGTKKVHVDDLIGKSGLQTKDVMATLTRLEIKDVVRPVPGGFYIRKV